MINSKIIHVIITIISIATVYMATNILDKNESIELFGNSDNWDITLKIEDRKSNLIIEPKESILNEKDDVYYSYNLYKDEEVVLEVRYDFFNYKSPTIEKRVSINEIYNNEEYEIEIECNDVRELINLNEAS